MRRVLNRYVKRAERMARASKVFNSHRLTAVTWTYLDRENCSTAIKKRLNIACLIGSEDRSCLAIPSIRKNANAGRQGKGNERWSDHLGRLLTKHSAGEHKCVVEHAFTRKLLQDIFHYLLHQRAEDCRISRTAVKRRCRQRGTFGKERLGSGRDVTRLNDTPLNDCR